MKNYTSAQLADKIYKKIWAQFEVTGNVHSTTHLSISPKCLHAYAYGYTCLEAY